jgi:hypothetical protein
MLVQLRGNVGPGPAPKSDAEAGVVVPADGGMVVIDSTDKKTR